MRYYLAAALALLFCLPSLTAQCDIVIDSLDEFDSSRLIAVAPLNLGHLVVSGNVPEDLEGEEYVEEAKAVFSFSYEKKVRSFFLSLAVVERKFHMIDNDYNVFLKFTDGTIMRMFNAPAAGEFDRSVLMWKYLHTIVVPMEVFHMMKHEGVEKIRINYKNYKKTVVLTQAQQAELQQAVRCVEQQLIEGVDYIKP